jgi:lysozyme
MKLSDAGLALVRDFEGFRSSAYPDPGSRDGLPITIGYGSTRWPDGSPIQLGQTVTRERAEAMLRNEIADTERAVSAAVTVPLSQSQFDALASFTYNLGAGALRSSTLLRKLNAGDYASAADEFGRWINNDGVPMEGLRRRRAAERAMFLSAQPVTVGERPQAPASPPPEPVASTPALSPRKPVAPVLAALLPTLVGMIPELAKLFGSGSAVSERNIKAAEKVAEVVVAATQSANLQAAVETMQSDPKARADAQAAVQGAWYELVESGGGGIDGARRANLDMTSGDSWRSVWWAAVLALLAVGVVIGGGAVMSALMFSELDESLIAQVLDYFKAAGFIVLGYAFGSSASSRAKDDVLAERVRR